MSRVTTDTRVFAPIEDAIEDIRQGKFVVVVDDEDRENEGDLTIAAQFATPEAVNFMATHGRGLVCLCLTEERCDELGLPPMAEHNEAPLGTAFTVTVEAREGVTTGISAHDRAHTIQVAVDPASTPHDLVQPGHIFPLRARRGGLGLAGAFEHPAGPRAKRKDVAGTHEVVRPLRRIDRDLDRV